MTTSRNDQGTQSPSSSDYLDEKEAYNRDGFTIVRSFLDDADFMELQDNLDRYIKDIVPTLPASEAFYEDPERPETLRQMQRMGCDSYFRDYGQDSRFQQLAEALLGEEVQLREPQWFNKPAGTHHVTPPHQDNYYFCLQPSHVLTIWLALDPVDAENGCLRFVPGSHLEGFRPHARSDILGFSQGITDYTPDDFTREVAIPLEPGDLIAHHGMTIHRADANMSKTRHRRAFAMVCEGLSCERDESAYKRYQQMVKKQHKEIGIKP